MGSIALAASAKKTAVQIAAASTEVGGQIAAQGISIASAEETYE